MSEQPPPYRTKPKVPLPSRLKNAAPTPQDRLLLLAAKWADLHAARRTRERMDEILAGLSEADARRVILCGQRIAAGLPPRIAP
jgi:hypothetical protein